MSQTLVVKDRYSGSLSLRWLRPHMGNFAATVSSTTSIFPCGCARAPLLGKGGTFLDKKSRNQSGDDKESEFVEFRVVWVT